MVQMIRPTRRDDPPLLPAIERSAGEAFRNLPDLAWIADDTVLSADEHLDLIAGGACWVAVAGDDRPLGFLSGECAGIDLHIRELAVRRERQGEGFGRALLGTAIGWARDAQLSGVTLTSFRNVAWNAPFYARLGFEILGPDQIDERLASILQQEAARGLDPGTRCAMRLRLTPGAA